MVDFLTWFFSRPNLDFCKKLVTVSEIKTSTVSFRGPIICGRRTICCICEVGEQRTICSKCLSTPPIPSWQQRGCRRPRLRTQKGQNLLTWCTKLVLQGGLLSRAFREVWALLSPVASDRFILVMLARDGFVGREEKKWPSFQITSPGPIRGGVPENRKRKKEKKIQFPVCFPGNRVIFIL